MGKGLLAQWRRGIATRGLLGASLLAVPVAVAAAIGFGTSLSGLAGGLSSFAEGPATTTTTSNTSPRKLNRAVVALVSRPESASTSAGAGSSPSTTGTGGGGGGAGSIPGDTTTTGGGTTGGSGDSGGSGGSTGSGTPTISTPDVELPSTGGGTGGTGDTIDNTVNGVNDALQDLGDTVNGILGQ